MEAISETGLEAEEIAKFASKTRLMILLFIRSSLLAIPCFYINGLFWIPVEIPHHDGVTELQYFL